MLSQVSDFVTPKELKSETDIGEPYEPEQQWP
jgi:hypothetical protein